MITVIGSLFFFSEWSIEQVQAETYESKTSEGKVS